MGVDGSVASSASQVFVLAIRDVLVGASISVLLGQAKVNDVNKVALLPQAHKEVVGLDVSVDEVLGVYVFDTADLRTEQRTGSAGRMAEWETPCKPNTPIQIKQWANDNCWTSSPFILCLLSHLILRQPQVKKVKSKTAERMTVKLVMSPKHNNIPFWVSYNKRQVEWRGQKLQWSGL